MALDPRTRLAKTLLEGNKHISTPPLSFSTTPTSEPGNQRTMTAKRRDMNALTEALLDPFSTTQEGGLAAIMLLAQRRLIVRPSLLSK